MNDNVKIAAVGDVMLGDFPLTNGFGVRSYIEKNPGINIFRHVKPIFDLNDICFGNLECVLSNVGYNPNDLKASQMRGSPESVKLLRNAGFNIMSISNNHIMQHGKEPFKETVKVLESERIIPIGIKNNDINKIYRSFKIKNLKICFLAYSLRPEKYSNEILYCKSNKNEIIEQIIEVKKKCDFLIVSLHWGDEFISYPSYNQISDAHSFIDAGANIILGHHPHILQPIEIYKNGLIAYSLGNFVFDFWQKKLRKTIILEIEISKKRIENYNITPLYIDNNYTPILMKSNEFKNESENIDWKIKKSKIYIEDKKYSELVKKLEIKNKIENRLYFLKNILRYKPSIIYQSFLNFIQNRTMK